MLGIPLGARRGWKGYPPEAAERPNTTPTSHIRADGERDSAQRRPPKKAISPGAPAGDVMAAYSVCLPGLSLGCAASGHIRHDSTSPLSAVWLTRAVPRDPDQPCRASCSLLPPPLLPSTKCYAPVEPCSPKVSPRPPAFGINKCLVPVPDVVGRGGEGEGLSARQTPAELRPNTHTHIRLS